MFDLQCHGNAEGTDLPDDSSKHTKRKGVNQNKPLASILVVVFLVMKNSTCFHFTNAIMSTLRSMNTF
jgi:hypothetical protein